MATILFVILSISLTALLYALYTLYGYRKFSEQYIPLIFLSITIQLITSVLVGYLSFLAKRNKELKIKVPLWFYLGTYISLFLTILVAIGKLSQ